MAYQEITENKTITLDANGGTTTLTYYAGNKEKTTGSVVGNVDKKTITYQFDTTVSWISSVSFSNKDDTAKNITVTYSKNDGTSIRTVNLKLKDQTSLYCLILRLLLSTPVSTDNYYFTITWNKSTSLGLTPGGPTSDPTVLYYYLGNTIGELRDCPYTDAFKISTAYIMSGTMGTMHDNPNGTIPLASSDIGSTSTKILPMVLLVAPGSSGQSIWQIRSITEEQYNWFNTKYPNPSLNCKFNIQYATSWVNGLNATNTLSNPPSAYLSVLKI